MRVFKIGLLVSAALLAQQPEERKQARRISIVAERFTFNPSRITVKEGELVEFVLQSDDTDHGFKIPSAGIDVAIPPIGKGEARVRFIGAAKGTYPFECSRACGAGHDLMRGVLTVR